MCVFYEKNNMKNIIYNDKNFADKNKQKYCPQESKCSLHLFCCLAICR